MCRLRNIAMRDYRTDRHTHRQTPDKVIPMCRYASQATQKAMCVKNHIPDGNKVKKSQGVFVKHYAPGGNKVQKGIFSFKVRVNITRSLTLVSFERLSLVEYACQI